MEITKQAFDRELIDMLVALDMTSWNFEYSFFLKIWNSNLVTMNLKFTRHPVYSFHYVSKKHVFS